jgi:hypothetical protein
LIKVVVGIKSSDSESATAGTVVIDSGVSMEAAAYADLNNVLIVRDAEKKTVAIFNDWMYGFLEDEVK